MNYVILAMNGKLTHYATDLDCTSAAGKVEAAHRAIDKCGEHGLSEVQKYFNSDYVAPSGHDYLADLSGALEAVQRAFAQNEGKHGKGLELSDLMKELDKCEGHAWSARFALYNHADKTYHLASAACRALKGLEILVRDLGQYPEGQHNG